MEFHKGCLYFRFRFLDVLYGEKKRKRTSIMKKSFFFPSFFSNSGLHEFDLRKRKRKNLLYEKRKPNNSFMVFDSASVSYKGGFSVSVSFLIKEIGNGNQKDTKPLYEKRKREPTLWNTVTQNLLDGKRKRLFIKVVGYMIYNTVNMFVQGARERKAHDSEKKRKQSMCFWK